MNAQARSTEAPSRMRAERALGRLVRNGGRRTHARLTILEILADSDQHLSAQEIHAVADHPTLSLSTVHRTLSALCDVGLVHLLPYPGEARFGLADVEQGHVVCTGCDKVTELPAEALEAVAGVVLAQTGQRVEPLGISIAVVTCEACLTSSDTSGV